MADTEETNPQRNNIWFLDSGCSNHMCGVQSMFTSLDESFSHSVKLGNNSRMSVAGKGSIKLVIGGLTYVIRNVYYVPELRNNLLSIGQLQEKGIAILIENGMCKLYFLIEQKLESRNPLKGLISETRMSRNRKFILFPDMESRTPLIYVFNPPPLIKLFYGITDLDILAIKD
ncbi:unnamed protein product [Rhodiola kirilowii]